MVWVGVLLEFPTELYIFRQFSVTAVQYQDEVSDLTVRFYVATVGLIFILMSNNAYPLRAVVINDVLETKGIVSKEWLAYSS